MWVDSDADSGFPSDGTDSLRHRLKFDLLTRPPPSSILPSLPPPPRFDHRFILCFLFISTLSFLSLLGLVLGVVGEFVSCSVSVSHVDPLSHDTPLFVRSCGTNFSRRVLFNRWRNDSKGVLDSLFPLLPCSSRSNAVLRVVLLMDGSLGEDWEDVVSRSIERGRLIVADVRLCQIGELGSCGLFSMENPLDFDYVFMISALSFIHYEHLLAFVSSLPYRSTTPSVFGYSYSLLSPHRLSLDSGILLNRPSSQLLFSSPLSITSITDLSHFIDHSNISLLPLPGSFPVSSESLLSHFDSPSSSLPRLSPRETLVPLVSFGNLTIKERRLWESGEEGTSRFPRIIHQIWLGPLPAPDEIRQCQIMFEQDPFTTWEYVLWDDSKVESWLISQKLYWNSLTYFQKADVVRYEILHRIGGIYVDADTICLHHSFDRFLSTQIENGETFQMFAGCENEFYRPGLIANGLIGMIPYSVTSFSLLNSLYLSSTNSMANPKLKAWIATGPLFFTTSIMKLSREVGLRAKIVSSAWFYPLHYTHLRKIQGGEERKRLELMRVGAEKGSVMAQLWGSTFSKRDGTGGK